MAIPVRTDVVRPSWSICGLAARLGNGVARRVGSVIAALLLSLPAVAAVLPNGGFESPSLFGNYDYAPANATWTFTGNAGITGNSNAFTSSNPLAPEGVQVGFLQVDGQVAQALVLAAGQYVLSFKAAQRANYQNGVQVVRVLVDGVQVGTYQPPGTSYTAYSTPSFPIAVGGSHTLTLAGAGTGYDFTAFVDDVSLSGSGGLAISTTSVSSSANPANAGVSITFTATVSGATPTGTVSFTDNGTPIPGCGSVALAGGGNSPTAPCTTSTLTAGSHNIVATYGGDGANAASASSAYVQGINGGAAPTTTTLSSSANPASFGQNVTFTATVTGITPTGTVTFTDNGTNICAASPVSGSGNARTATCATTSLSVGLHTNIRATYNGDGGNAPSTSSALTQTINPATTPAVVVVTSSANPTDAGVSIDFTATVTGAAPTGTVTFAENGLAIAACPGALPLTGSGNTRNATCTTSALSAGLHSIVATYSGDANNSLSSSAPYAQTISGSTPVGLPNGGFEAPGLFGSYDYGPDGASWTFDSGAGIAGNANPFTDKNAPAPEGVQVGFLQNHASALQHVGLAGGTYVVSFEAAQRCNYQDGIQVVQVLIDDIEVGRFEPPADFTPPPGPAKCPYAHYDTPPFTVGGGIHTLKLAGVGGGGYDFTAFVDDVRLTGSGGATLTTTTLVSSANPANVGFNVTFTATVSGNAPTGAVTFTDNGLAIAGCATVPLTVAGTADCSTSALSAGGHSIVASYSGDGANAGSVSTVLTQVVNAVAGATTTTLTSSPNPASAGTSILFTATVTGAAPTGTVTFKEGLVQVPGCAPAALSGFGNVRTATCTTSSLTVGVHSIVASYGGDVGNGASASGPYAQTINPAQAATVTMITNPDNPANVLVPITFTATVTGAAPTGTVEFTDGGVDVAGCSAVVLTGSGNTRTAACTTSALAPGVHSIVANYNGDANNKTSISAPYAQLINGTPPAGLPNGGFETPRLFGDYAYLPDGATWVFEEGAGIAGYPNGFTDANAVAPEGVQVAFLQNSGSATETLNLAAGQYVVSFFAAQRCNFQDGVQVVQVKIDGIEVGRYEPPVDLSPPPGETNCPYSSYITLPFTLAVGGTHTLKLKGIGGEVSPGAGYDFTAFVDDVDVVPVP